MKLSAGLLIYKREDEVLKVLLVHPGGPYWKNKDKGAWSIPKGEFSTDEDGLKAAIRESEEETGKRFEGNFLPLNAVKLKSGKMVYAWAIESDYDTKLLVSNTFLLEWPPRSGKRISVPEVDCAKWFDTEIAQEKLNAAQWNLVEQLLLILKSA